MEKLVDKYIWDGALKEFPLHQNQFAYQTGKPAETALHNVISPSEYVVTHKEMALEALLDIEGVFN
jgi:hypothetical protein